MTPQEINERIAKLCGKGNLYFVKKRGLFYRPNAHGYTANKNEAWRLPFEEAKLHQYDCDEQPVTIHKCEPPDYCNSLDACREFEQEVETQDYIHQLHMIMPICKLTLAADPSLWILAYLKTTPQQRCEAFLRVKGQWE